MKLKRIAVVVVLLVAVAATLGFFFPFWHKQDNLRLPGVVEIQEVRLGSKVGGRVAEVYIMEGDMVQPGQMLVRFEAPELEAQRKQTEAHLNAMRAELDRYRNGSRPEEIREAKNEWESADADARWYRDEFVRMERLFAQKAASQADLDAMRANRNRSVAKAAATKAHLDLVLAGTRSEVIAQSEANVAETQAKLDEINANLREAEVRSPSYAVVEVLSVRKGDLIPPNTPIVRILKTEDLWVRVYVPETQLGKVRVDQTAYVTIDSYPGRRFEGRVIQVSSQSEFTPRNIQSVDERRYQVFGVKVRVEQPDDPRERIFKSGMAAEVFLPLEE
jgi:multidrug resistance efflux pump